jgi:Ser/Thr protein kinase RdoA (MazF antagonist)
MAVDFDDCLTGPVEQDLWLLFPGLDEDSLKERERFLDAYKEMTRKSHLKMNLTEPLRTMRMVHFNSWIAKRWEDHSFQSLQQAQHFQELLSILISLWLGVVVLRHIEGPMAKMLQN